LRGIFDFCIETFIVIEIQPVFHHLRNLYAETNEISSEAKLILNKVDFLLIRIELFTMENVHSSFFKKGKRQSHLSYASAKTRKKPKERFKKHYGFYK